MAGHSHAKNIKHKKDAQDIKRSKIFTKLQREIFVSVKQGGADEKFNPKLRLARQKARFHNMPNDKINEAIKRATDAGNAGSNYEDCYYLIAYSGGIFILVKALTDNKNRTASDVRGIASSFDASISESSAIDFLFLNFGFIKYLSQNINFDKLFEKAVLLGAISIDEIDEEKEDKIEKIIQITSALKDFNLIKTGLEENFGEPREAGLTWKAQNNVEVSVEVFERIEKLKEDLEELDDVQELFINIV
jgi:YebC/PmpR family DNA-binding regulatory protein